MNQKVMRRIKARFQFCPSEKSELYLKIPDGSVMIVIPMYIGFIIVWIQDSLTGSRCHCWGQEKIALIALNSRIIGAQGFVVITADSVHHIISDFVMGTCKKFG